MDPLQIALIVLVVAGVWALVELALVFRRARASVDGIDRTVAELNDAVADARPVIAKLDDAVDDLAPSLAQIDPLLKQANVAMEGLSADIIEVNGILRDVSEVTGSVSSASSAVSGITDAATDKVVRLLSKRRKPAADGSRALVEPAANAKDGREGAPAITGPRVRANASAPDSPVCDVEPGAAAPSSGYFTYGDASDEAGRNAQGAAQSTPAADAADNPVPFPVEAPAAAASEE